ncbi:A24 family peptidase [Microbacterium sp. VKM Ac-2870]|uniref:prepilin peptidase n=1 Tax=Microbacterium sp. VKM Ac-2870 TaxID=2783825 RepID=UPI002B26D0A2|nr:A24 family peptidase [Microbacterium sp. VKM Ac-2870]
MSEGALVAIAGVSGLIAGLGVDTLVLRVVPSGPPRHSRPRAQRAVVVAATGVAFSLVMMCALRSAGWGQARAGESSIAFALSTAAYLLIASAGIALTLVDVRTHRLPNVIVLPLLAATVALFAASCLFGAPWSALVRAVSAGAALFAFFAVLRAVGRGAMGGGDVKLAAVVGIALGWIGWHAVLAGTLAAFVLGGLVGLALIVTRRATRSTAIPFGPFLVAGTWVGMLTADGVL